MSDKIDMVLILLIILAEELRKICVIFTDDLISLVKNLCVIFNIYYGRFAKLLLKIIMVFWSGLDIYEAKAFAPLTSQSRGSVGEGF